MQNVQYMDINRRTEMLNNYMVNTNNNMVIESMEAYVNVRLHDIDIKRKNCEYMTNDKICQIRGVGTIPSEPIGFNETPTMLVGIGSGYAHNNSRESIHGIPSWMMGNEEHTQVYSSDCPAKECTGDRIRY